MDKPKVEAVIGTYAEMMEDDLHRLSPGERQRLADNLQKELQPLPANERRVLVERYSRWALEKREEMHGHASTLLTLLNLRDADPPAFGRDSAVSKVFHFLDAGIDEAAQRFLNAHDFALMLMEAANELSTAERKKRK